MKLASHIKLDLLVRSPCSASSKRISPDRSDLDCSD